MHETQQIQTGAIQTRVFSQESVAFEIFAQLPHDTLKTQLIDTSHDTQNPRLALEVTGFFHIRHTVKHERAHYRWGGHRVGWNDFGNIVLVLSGLVKFVKEEYAVIRII